MASITSSDDDRDLEMTELASEELAEVSHYHLFFLLRTVPLTLFII
jgi:hypothetical protein